MVICLQNILYENWNREKMFEENVFLLKKNIAAWDSSKYWQASAAACRTVASLCMKMPYNFSNKCSHKFETASLKDLHYVRRKMKNGSYCIAHSNKNLIDNKQRTILYVCNWTSNFRAIEPKSLGPNSPKHLAAIKLLSLSTFWTICTSSAEISRCIGLFSQSSENPRES